MRKHLLRAGIKKLMGAGGSKARKAIQALRSISRGLLR